MLNVSSAMGGQFAVAMTEMTERVKKLGPSPLRYTQERNI
jgi:coenzyme F420-reducing hydrogenase delta subunit